MNHHKSLGALVTSVAAQMRAHKARGRVADYIPALARVDGAKFGIAVVTCDGEVAQAGDADETFSVQSVSKIFALTMALERIGGKLWKRVGHEPSGTPFNSIVQLEREAGLPRNPLINAGALVVTDVLLEGRTTARVGEELLAFMRACADDENVAIDEEVAGSEISSGFRNASLANFLAAYGNLRAPVGDVLKTYFRQCALAMSCRQLARAGLYLANAGIDPLTRQEITSAARARRINAIMMTCGHYDASGDFAFRVGLPGKSGVGGGILAVAPGRAAIAVWSPGLNEAGNSLRGVLALERVAEGMGWSVF